MSFEMQALSSTVPYFTIGVLGINILLLIVFVFATSAFIKRMVLSREEAEKIRRKAHGTAQEILERSRQEALKTVSEAHIKAEAMLGDTKTFVGSREEKLQRALDDFSRNETERIVKTSDKLLESYKSLVGGTEKKHSQDIENVFQKMEKAVEQGISQFQKTLGEEITRSHEEADSRIRDWHENSQREIDEYKREALKRVDEAVYKILVLVSHEVLGKTLDMETHRDLVLKALAEAKKEGFFRP